MQASDMNPVQKQLLVQALQAVCNRHASQGNDGFIIDLLLAPKETQEAIIRELANVAIGSLAQNIQAMQAVAAMQPPVMLPDIKAVDKSDVPPPPPPPPLAEQPTEAAAPAGGPTE